MILIPEDFFKKYISTRNDHDIYKLTKKLEKRVKKLEKYINKNKVCYEEINYESQLIKARQEYNYLSCIFLQKEFEIIPYSESAIREIMDIIKDKKAYEIVDKKKLRYHPKVADLNKVVSKAKIGELITLAEAHYDGQLAKISEDIYELVK